MFCLSILFALVLTRATSVQSYHEPEHDEVQAYEYLARSAFKDESNLQEWKDAVVDTNTFFEATSFANGSFTFNARASSHSLPSLGKKMVNSVVVLILFGCLFSIWFLVWLIVQCVKCCCCINPQEFKARKCCWNENGPSKFLSFSLRILYFGMGIGILIGIGTIGVGLRKIGIDLSRYTNVLPEVRDHLSEMEKITKSGGSIFSVVHDSLYETLNEISTRYLPYSLYYTNYRVDQILANLKQYDYKMQNFSDGIAAQTYPTSHQAELETLREVKFQLSYKKVNSSYGGKKLVITSAALLEGTELTQAQKDAIDTLSQTISATSPYNSTAESLAYSVRNLESAVRHIIPEVGSLLAHKFVMIAAHSADLVTLPQSLIDEYRSGHDSFLTTLDNYSIPLPSVSEAAEILESANEARSQMFNISDGMLGLLACSNLSEEYQTLPPAQQSLLCQKARVYLAGLDPYDVPSGEHQIEVPLANLASAEATEKLMDALTAGSTALAAGSGKTVKDALRSALDQLETENTRNLIVGAGESIGDIVSNVEMNLNSTLDQLAWTTGLFDDTLAGAVGNVSRTVDDMLNSFSKNNVVSQARNGGSAMYSVAWFIIILAVVKMILTMFCCGSSCIGCSIGCEFAGLTCCTLIPVVIAAFAIVMSYFGVYVYNGGVTDLLQRKAFIHAVNERTPELLDYLGHAASVLNITLPRTTGHGPLLDITKAVSFSTDQFLQTVAEFVDFQNASANSTLISGITTLMDAMTASLFTLYLDGPANPLLRMTNPHIPPAYLSLSPAVKSKVLQALNESSLLQYEFVTDTAKVLSPKAVGTSLHLVADPVLINISRSLVYVWMGLVLILSFSIPHLIFAILGRKEWPRYASRKDSEGNVVFFEQSRFPCCRTPTQRTFVSHYSPKEDGSSMDYDTSGDSVHAPAGTIRHQSGPRPEYARISSMPLPIESNPPRHHSPPPFAYLYPVMPPMAHPRQMEMHELPTILPSAPSQPGIPQFTFAQYPQLVINPTTIDPAFAPAPAPAPMIPQVQMPPPVVLHPPKD